MSFATRLSTLILLGTLAACSAEETSTAPESAKDTALGKDYPTEWSQEQINAYEHCLQDSMAQATAWELIEQQCKESVNGSLLLLDTETP